MGTVRSQYEAVARQATAETWSYAEFLRELVERECQQRQHNRVERLLKGKFRSAGAHAPGEIFDAKDVLAALGPDHSTFEIVVA